MKKHQSKKARARKTSRSQSPPLVAGRRRLNELHQHRNRARNPEAKQKLSAAIEMQKVAQRLHKKAAKA